MSTRGINFLDRWMAQHLPNAISDDPMAIVYLVDEAMNAAEAEGIDPDEISQEVGSLSRCFSGRCRTARAAWRPSGNSPTSVRPSNRDRQNGRLSEGRQ
ncbi:hypothetical protein CK224_29295 [Mesorhizobium sp. WSM3862]|nr:hypothetical protein CK224_29295 [Mesorhizobium sp. WSM3862]